MKTQIIDNARLHVERNTPKARAARGPEAGDDKEGRQDGKCRTGLDPPTLTVPALGIKLRAVAWGTRPMVRLVQRQPKLTRNEISRAAARR